MMYLSKGIVCKGKSGKELYIRHFGQPMRICGAEAQMWQNARFGFAYASTSQEVSIVESLVKKGIAICLAMGYGDLDKYCILCRCAICANPKFRIGFSPVNATAKRILTWLRKAGTNLTLPELVTLEDKGIKPVTKLLYSENRIKLLKIIHPWSISIAGELENRMKHSVARKKTVDAVLELLRRKRIVIM